MQLIIPTSPFLPLSYGVLLAQADSCMVEYHENFQKRSIRNRYTILATNGLQQLSIPLQKGKNNQQPINLVQIAYEEDWPRIHLQAIRSSYGKSPYFEHYFDLLEAILTAKHEKLWDLNAALQQFSTKALRIVTPISQTTVYQKTYGDGYIDLRSITIEETPLKPYNQVFEYKYGFMPDVSLLDLIFCLGPQGGRYLREQEEG